MQTQMSILKKKKKKKRSFLIFDRLDRLDQIMKRNENGKNNKPWNKLSSKHLITDDVKLPKGQHTTGFVIILFTLV